MPIPAGGDETLAAATARNLTTRTYWVGSQFTVDWRLVDEAGEPVIGAAVTGTVTRPDGTTAPMTVMDVGGGLYTALYVPTTPGTHAWRAVDTDLTQDAVEGEFVVARSLVGAAPITLDPGTPVGMVRLLITDVDEVDPLFEDAQLAALLTAEGGNAKLAAASALEVIARSELLIAKKISTQDLSTDGPAVAAELRAQATSLRAQASAAGVGGSGQALLPVWSFPTPVAWGDDYL